MSGNTPPNFRAHSSCLSCDYYALSLCSQYTQIDFYENPPGCRICDDWKEDDDTDIEQILPNIIMTQPCNIPTAMRIIGYTDKEIIAWEKSFYGEDDK